MDPKREHCNHKIYSFHKLKILVLLEVEKLVKEVGNSHCTLRDEYQYSYSFDIVASVALCPVNNYVVIQISGLNRQEQVPNCSHASVNFKQCLRHVEISRLRAILHPDYNFEI